MSYLGLLMDEQQQQGASCLNCGHELGQATYCPSCGQKNTPIQLRLKNIFGNFFAVLINLDNQFFRTLRAALVPGKLATEYLKGKRKTYLHPLRFFFYSWVLLALVMSWVFRSNSDSVRQEKKVSDSIFKFSIDDNEEMSLSDANLDSLREEITQRDFVVTVGPGATLRFVADSSKVIPPTDSVKTILFSDFENLPRDSLFKKYEITHWIDKYTLNRMDRLNSGIEDVGRYMMDHFIWLFFGIIPFSALALWAMFGRYKKFYAEHILYLLYLFGFFFLFIILMILADNLPLTASRVVIFLLMVGWSVYSFYSLRNYYGQGKKKVFFRWLIYLFINFFLFTVFSIIYSVISVAAF